MKRSLFAFALFVLFAASVTHAKDTWTSVRSKNFHLIGNAGEKDIRKVGVRLEQFRHVFSRIFANSKSSSPIPITVIVFKNDGAFKPYKPLYNGKPASVAGYFQSGKDVNYIALTAELRETNPYAVIFHEYVHALTADNTSPLPPWLSEGIAEYYSTFEVEGNEKKVLLGKAHANHVFFLREKSFFPLPRLFSVAHGSPDYNERDRQGVFYAQSWALVHYLLLGANGKYNAQFREFVLAQAQGKPVDESFKQIFKTDYATIEKELRDYIGRSAYPVTIYTFEEKLSFDSEMQSAPLGEAEVEYYLGDLLCHTRRREEGEAMLRRAMTLDPNLASASAAIGISRFQEQKYSEAKNYLEKAVAANSKNHMAHFYYAYSMFRELFPERQLMSGPPSPEQIKPIRAALDQVIALAPDFPETYNLLGFLHLMTNENLDTGINAVTRAISLAPGREDFIFTLAQLQMRKENYPEARRLMKYLSERASDPGLRSHAESMLATIARIEDFKTGSNRSDVMKTMPGESTMQVEPIAPASRPVLRRGEGDKLVGKLTRVDCDDQGMTLTIRGEGEKVLTLHTDRPDRVQFVTYSQNTNGEITCGPLNPARGVIVLYRASTDASSKYDGEPITVTFTGKVQ